MEVVELATAEVCGYSMQQEHNTVLAEVEDWPCRLEQTLCGIVQDTSALVLPFFFSDTRGSGGESGEVNLVDYLTISRTGRCVEHCMTNVWQHYTNGTFVAHKIISYWPGSTHRQVPLIVK